MALRQMQGEVDVCERVVWGPRDGDGYPCPGEVVYRAVY